MCLTEIELIEMKHAVNFLQPFQAATQEMSGKDYVNLSKVIPLSKSLQQLTADINVSSICLGQYLTTEMAHRQTSYWLFHACLILSLRKSRFQTLVLWMRVLDVWLRK